MYSLEKRMAIHSSILAWRIPRTEKPGGYSPWGRKELDRTERLTHIDVLVWNAIIPYIWPHLLNISHVYMHLFTHSLTHSFIYFINTTGILRNAQILCEYLRKLLQREHVCVTNAQIRISDSSPKLPVSPPVITSSEVTTIMASITMD